MTSIAAESFELMQLAGRRLVVAPDLHFGKTISKHGHSRLFGGPKHHSRRDEQLSHREMAAREPRKGGRGAALERVIARDVEQQLDDSVDEPLTEREEPILRGYSQPAYQFEETRRHADLRELGDLVVWLPREKNLGIQARAELALLQVPSIFSARVEKLEADAEIDDYGVATLLEENDRLVYGHLTGS